MWEFACADDTGQVKLRRIGLSLERELMKKMCEEYEDLHLGYVLTRAISFTCCDHKTVKHDFKFTIFLVFHLYLGQMNLMSF